MGITLSKKKVKKLFRNQNIKKEFISEEKKEKFIKKSKMFFLMQNY